LGSWNCFADAPGRLAKSRSRLVAAEAGYGVWQGFGGGVGVGEDFVFVVPDQDHAVVAVGEVVGIDGDLAASAGSVDDELRDRITGGVAAELLDDFDAFGDAGAEVRGAFDEIESNLPGNLH
jgi:hypothetical protein